MKEIQKKYTNKPMHGQYAQALENEQINKKKSIAWLRSAGLKEITESLLIAAQDQMLATNYYKNKILKKSVKKKQSHIVSGCPMLAKHEYLERHNRVAKFIHWTICKIHGFEVKKEWFEHEIRPVIKKDELTVLWDSPIHTDRNIQANKPDIVVKDEKKRECTLVNISIPSDTNIVSKTSEKLANTAICK